MDMLLLTAKTREANGKGGARKKRASGLVPITIYGEGQAPASIEVDLKNFERVTHGKLGRHAFIDVTVEDDASLNGPAVIRAVQNHPITDKVLSADFQRIRLDKKIVTLVPIKLTGHCKGLVLGGIPDQHLHQLQIEALPLDVPENIEADITEVGLGGTYHVSDIKPVQGVTILTAPERSVIAIKVPRTAKRPTGPAADAKAAKGGAKK
ncbi:MAG: hypothetical protein RLZZ303_1739 [Candidatus Hydrogenedentota bacterium]|jgi:large subunit ribosomal protein L25